MTLGFFLLIGGLVLLYAGVKGGSVSDALGGTLTGPDHPVTPFAGGGTSPAATPTTATGGAGYVYPFVHAQGVKKTSIDQGVDFVGKGPIGALGDAVIEAVYPYGSSSSGWPEGGYVRYRLLNGENKGKRVYVAEGVSPTVKVNQRVAAGEPVAIFHGNSIETGWAGAGTAPAIKSALRDVAGAPGHAFDQFLKTLSGGQ